MDGTLALLYSSATSRGLPHKLTRNLSFLFLSEYKESTRVRSWQPRNTYPVGGRIVDAKKAEKRRVDEEFQQKTRDMVRQVVKLAEARDDISLGRVKLRRSN